MKLQADPTNAAAVLEAWKAENPGYEGMGDWLKINQEQLANAGETVQSAQEILDKKNKEASDFVNNNELFGATDGAKQILEELGFNTEGFGAMGNDPESNPTYQALASFKEANPDQFELFQQNLVNMDKEDLAGLNGADISTIMQTLGTKEGMQEFNFLRELNNKLATTDTSDYAGVLGSILPEGHALRDLASDPEVASQYLADLNQMKELGVLTPGLEALSALMDEDGDGNLDSPEDMAANIQELLGDGFNLGNFQSDEAKQIMDLVNNTDKDFGSFITNITTAKTKSWADYQAKLQTKHEQMQTAASDNVVANAKNQFVTGVGADRKTQKKLDAAFKTLMAGGTPNFKKMSQKDLPAIAKAMGLPEPKFQSINALASGKAGKRANYKARLTNFQLEQKLKKELAKASKNWLSTMEANMQNAKNKAAKKSGYDPNATNPWENF
jgi:hypothetical protein